MNKHARVSLVGMITVVLLLAIAIPAFAKPVLTDSCILSYPANNNSTKKNVLSFPLTGNLEVNWDPNGTLVNICTGIVPFGQVVNPGITYLIFDELCNLPSWTCNARFASTSSAYFDTMLRIVDPECDWYWTDTWGVEIDKEDAEFVFTKEYTP